MFYLRPEEFWQELTSNISNLYSFNTVLHQRISQQSRTLDKFEVLLPIPSNAASFLLRPMYFNCFPLLYTVVQYLKIHTYQTMVITFSTNTHSSALGHHVTPLTMLSPVISTHCLQHCTYAVSGAQNITTELAYDHINDNFFIYYYSKTEIICSIQGHFDKYPDPTCKIFSQQCPAHSILAIYVFPKQFSS
jgi:hypothetical protein